MQQCLASGTNEEIKVCQKELETLEALLAAREMVPELSGVDDGLASDGETPFIMGGEASDLGMTAGPNFQLGRRTWTDVFGE